MSHLEIRQLPDERFRKTPRITLVDLEKYNLDDWEVYGYLLGNGIKICQTLTVDHFDSLCFLEESQNPKQKGVFLHVMAHKSRENKNKILVLQPRQEKKAIQLIGSRGFHKKSVKA